MSRLGSRLGKSLSKRGAQGTLVFGAQLLGQLLSGRLLLKYLSGRRAYREDRAFDAVYGIDTAGQVNNNDLSTSSENKIFAVSYQPINGPHFQQQVGALGIRFEDFTFVDLGCGKGRALLLASGFPFRRIVGVEFDARLVEVAKQNILRYPVERMACKDIEVLCLDATRYAFPEGPLLVYLYNPFEAPVMHRVVDALRRSYEQDPRKIVIAYFTPMHTEAWDAQAFLERLDGDGDPVVYATIERSSGSLRDGHTAAGSPAGPAGRG